MVLVDSSIWVLAERRGIPVGAFLRDDEIIATCPPVVQEILRGTSGAAHYRHTRALLMGTTMLDAPMPFERFEEAAQLYIRCRDAGVTVRSSIDCLVAACAIAHGVPLLHDDRDFKMIARVEPLQIFTRS